MNELILPYEELDTFGYTCALDIFIDACRENPDKIYHLSRTVLTDGTFGPYSGKTYKEIYDTVKHLAGMLKTLGIKKGDNVGIFAQTRGAWCIADLATQFTGAVVVPLYDTQSDSDLALITRQCELKALFLQPSLSHRLEEILDAGNSLHSLIFFDDLDSDAYYLSHFNNYFDTVPSIDSRKIGGKAIPLAKSETIDLALSNLETFTKRGFRTQLCSSAFDYEPVDTFTCSPEDLATIVFTSGSSGSPKGAMITHHALLCGTLVMASCVPQHDLREFALLPLAHIYGRVAQYVVLFRKGQTAYFSGSPRFFIEDCQAAKPTIMAVVPRLLERLYSGATEKLNKSGILVKTVFKLAFAYQKYSLTKGWGRSSLLDTLIFNKIKSILGGNMMYLCSGSAPLSEDVYNFIYVSFGADVTEGYGSTEACGVAAYNPLGSFAAGQVGHFPPGFRAKLRDVPEMNYTTCSDTPTGELLLAGDPMFSGYLGYPDEKTFELGKDGIKWFATGDVASLVGPIKNVKIIDRIKTIHKLANGEFVFIQNIESCYSSIPTINSIYVYGDGTRSFLVACVQPEFSELYLVFPHFTGKPEEAIRDKEVQAYYLQQLSKVCSSSLKPYERLRYIVIDYSQDWTPEKGLLTSSLKVRRGPLKERCMPIFERFYQIDQSTPNKAKEIAKARPRVRLFDLEGRKCGVAIIDKQADSYDGFTTAISAN